MEELMKDVETVFTAISNIPVAGEAVDAVALARVKLRNIYARLKEISDSTGIEEEV